MVRIPPADRNARSLSAMLFSAFVFALLLVVPANAFAAGPNSIKGTVYNNQSGDEIVGLRVKLYTYNEDTDLFKYSTSTTSDASGDYVFSGLADGDYGIAIDQGATDVNGEDYKLYMYDGADTWADASTIHFPDDSLWDGDGSATVFSGADLFPDPGGPSISGTVKGSDLSPQLAVGDVEIDLFQFGTDPDTGDSDVWYVTDWANTDSGGHYEFWSEPTGVYRVGYTDQGPTGEWGVRWKSKYYPNAPTVEAAGNVTFTAGLGAASHLTGKNIVLDKARALFGGTVYTVDSTGAVTGRAGECDVNLMSAVSSEAAPIAETVTNSEGAYKLYDADLPLGTTVPTDTVLQFGGFDYTASFWDHATTWEGANVLSVGPASSLSAKDGFVSELAPDLAGTVTDSVTSSGVAGALVLVYAADATNTADFVDASFTDGDGSYQLWEPSGDYKIYFYTGAEADSNLSQFRDVFYGAPRYSSEWFENKADQTLADVLTLSAGTTTECDAALAINPTPSITGVARETSGTPLAGVQPMAYALDAETGDYDVVGWAADPTDSSGEYAIYGLDVNQYKVGHDSELGLVTPLNGTHYAPGFYDHVSTSVDDATWVLVNPGSTTTGIDVPYEALMPLVTGHVVDVHGQPVRGARVDSFVFLTDPFGEFSDWEPAGPWAVTDADGNYSLFGPQGAYKIGFSAEGYIDQLYKNVPMWNAQDDFNASASTTVTTNASSTVTGVDATLTLEPYVASRTDGHLIGASSRYTVAADIADQVTSGGSEFDGPGESFAYTPDIILACGEDRAMADPLAAAGLSWAYDNAPMLLTPSGYGFKANYSKPYVPAFVLSRIKTAINNIRLTHTGVGITLHIVGGRGSVPDARISEIRNYVQKGLGLTTSELNKALIVTRVDGKTRYDNSRIIAAEMRARRGAEMPDKAFVVNGSDPKKFFDAMAAAPISASSGVPMILIQTNSVPSPARSTVASLAPGTELVVVGPVSDITSAAAVSIGATSRVKGAGSDSYNTAAAVTTWGIAQGFLGEDTIGICSKLPDALGAGTFLGMNRGGMLFTTPGTTTVPKVTTDFLSAHKATLQDVNVFGGTGSITPSAVSKINAALKQ